MSAKMSSFQTRFVGDPALRLVGCLLIGSILVCAQSSDGQAKPSVPASSPSSAGSALEFPVTMRQNVVAGKTPVGTKVEAKLTIATLVSGAVIPEGAVFSGEVVDSVAKTATESSRLAIRMDSVQWKKQSKTVKVFLTAWYYPILMGHDAEVNDPNDRSIMRTQPGDNFPNPRMPPDAFPPPRVSESRVAMKDVESTREDDGTIALTSKKTNIKLDRTTTYVFASGDLTAGKPPAH